MRSVRTVVFALVCAIPLLGVVGSATPAYAGLVGVTTTADEFGTGADCSLREAIQAANIGGTFENCLGAAGGTNTILIPAGTYTITRAGLEDANVNGDFDITSDLTISQVGAGTVTVDGGGIDRVFHVVSGSLTLSRINVTGGDSQGNFGAGIFVNAGALTARDLSITSNSNANFGGGIVALPGTSVLLERVNLSGNSATNVAGAAYFFHGTATIRDSLLSGNSAPNVGATVTDGATVQFENVTVSGNRALHAGGIQTYMPGATTTVINSTLVDNGQAGGDAGNIYTETSGVVILRNTLVADANGGTNNCTINVGGTITSQGSNLSDDTSCATSFNQAGDQNNIEPLLGPLQNNGGPTQTYALQTGSPAIDGVVGACPLATDQRNIPRPKDGNADGVATCDIGAFEAPAVGKIQFTSATYTAGESDGTSTITVTRVNGSEGAVSGSVVASNGTAVSPADYTAGAAAFSYLDGASGNRTVQVTIGSDLVDEADETVNLAFGVFTGSPNVGTPSTAVLTITDDDPTPSLSIDDVSVTEGNGGAVSAAFTVTLGAPSGQQVTVQAQTADGSAQAPADYTALGPVTVTFAAGVTTQPVTVQVQGDTLHESNETFVVNLTAPVNATIADPQGTGTITDDDSAPGLSINDVSVTEGNSGTVNATFTVTLAVPSGSPVTVQAQTANGTAQAGSDYTATGPTTLTFAPGLTSQPFVVPVRGDTTYEANETFMVNLSGAVGASIGDGQGTGVIVNDEIAPSVAINSISVTEGNGGVTAATFTLTLSPANDQAATVQAQTADGTATAGSDYTALGPVTVTFAPGETTRTLTVQVLGDPNLESDEAFVVNLSSPTNATIATGQGRATILNDDGGVQQAPDDNQDKRKKETEEQQRQRENTNRGNRDDAYVEGNVVEIHQDEQPPYVLLANRDGMVKVVLHCGDQCPTIRVGDYLEADGEKQHEQLFEGTDVTVKHPGR